MHLLGTEATRRQGDTETQEGQESLLNGLHSVEQPGIKDRDAQVNRLSIC